MYIRKSSWLISLIISGLIMIWLSVKQELSLTRLSDLLFLWSLPLLIVGGFLWVFASGFFDHFQYSMKKAFTKEQEDYQKLSTIGKQSYAFWIQPGMFLLLLSLILLMIDVF